MGRREDAPFGEPRPRRGHPQCSTQPWPLVIEIESRVAIEFVGVIVRVVVESVEILTVIELA